MSKAGRFELVAGDAALDLVNTLDWRFRPSGTEELLPSYDELVRFVEASGLIGGKRAKRLRRGAEEKAGAAVLRAVKALREALAEICYSTLDGREPKGAALAELHAAVRQAQAHRELAWREGKARWSWLDDDDPPEGPLWRLALVAVELVTSERFVLLRACGDPACRWLFLDTSKNHSRRWCDMKVCGNRMKARRFKARTASEPEPERANTVR